MIWNIEVSYTKSIIFVCIENRLFASKDVLIVVSQEGETVTYFCLSCFFKVLRKMFFSLGEYTFTNLSTVL